MWQRFTENARKTIFYAQEESQRFGEGYVSTEHILLGICRDVESTAAKVVEGCGSSLPHLKALVERQLTTDRIRPPNDMTLTPRAKRVIDLAYEESRNLGNGFIGTEHLLLGLIREADGMAGRVLQTAKIYLDQARRVCREIQESQGVTRSETSPTGPKMLGLPYSPTTIPVRVRYDLQLLHPVDQLLLALLSDDLSDLGKALRQECPALNLVLPSVLAVMTKAFIDDRPTLTAVLVEAQLISVKDGRHQLKVEDLYLACIQWTTDDVRDSLKALGVNPFPK